MKYAAGEQAQLGDRVTLGDNSPGTVVASIDTDEYSTGHPKSEWGYLKRGIVVEFSLFGVIHYEEPEPGLRLLERARSSTHEGAG
jgi:hypothetical protein